MKYFNIIFYSFWAIFFVSMLATFYVNFLEPSTSECRSSVIVDMQRNLSGKNQEFNIVFEIDDHYEIIPISSDNFYKLHIRDEITVCQNIGNLSRYHSDWRIK